MDNICVDIYCRDKLYTTDKDICVALLWCFGVAITCFVFYMNLSFQLLDRLFNTIVEYIFHVIFKLAPVFYSSGSSVSTLLPSKPYLHRRWLIQSLAIWRFKISIRFLCSCSYKSLLRNSSQTFQNIAFLSSSKEKIE